MTKVVVNKYTPAHEARIEAEAPLNQAKATALAAEFGEGFSTRSVIAKAVRMGVAYERKQPTTKSGSRIEKKETIVSEIAQIVGASLDGLEKAPKPVLQAIRDFVSNG